VKEKEFREQPPSVMQYNILDSLVQRLYDIIDGSISVLQEHGELPPA
jgi:hypothetical protein